MSKLKEVGMELIHPNPYRLISTYPYIEAKLDSLVRSINDVGFWEGVIARPNPEGSGYQIAFGHHRIEAAKRAGLNRAPIIVRELTDEQMIQFMGRENGEDYKADFITMLNTWEGAKKFGHGRKNVEIARLLGWVDKTDKMTRVANACAHAHSLIESGHMKIEDFAGMSVRAVRDLVAPAVKEIKRAETNAANSVKSGLRTEKQAKQVRERQVTAAVSGVKATAKSVRSGKVAPKEIRSKTTSNIAEKKYGPGGVAKYPSDFIVVMRQTSERLHKTLNMDANREKIDSALKVVQHLPDDEHLAPMRQIVNELEQLKTRADELIERISSEVSKRKSGIREKNVSSLKMIEGGGA